jgi:hypothetical protein
MRQKLAVTTRRLSRQPSRTSRPARSNGVCREGDPCYTAYLFADKQLSLPLEPAGLQMSAPEAAR